ncbi:MAG: tetratricopeptide repeat protein [Dechloromonas sp.]|nr:tetratricopeptide repeat protein [Dechloromonas sp.]
MRKNDHKPHIFISLCLCGLLGTTQAGEPEHSADRIAIQRHDWLAPSLTELAGQPPLNQIGLLRQLQTQHPTDPRLPALLGTLLARQQRWPEARQAFEDALQLRPADPDTRYNLAICLEHLGRQDEAIQRYQQALRLAGQSPFRFEQAQVWQRLNELAAIP